MAALLRAFPNQTLDFFGALRWVGCAAAPARAPAVLCVHDNVRASSPASAAAAAVPLPAASMPSALAPAPAPAPPTPLPGAQRLHVRSADPGVDQA